MNWKIVPIILKSSFMSYVFPVNLLLKTIDRVYMYNINIFLILILSSPSYWTTHFTILYYSILKMFNTSIYAKNVITFLKFIYKQIFTICICI